MQYDAHIIAHYKIPQTINIWSLYAPRYQFSIKLQVDVAKEEKLINNNNNHENSKGVYHGYKVGDYAYFLMNINYHKLEG